MTDSADLLALEKRIVEASRSRTCKAHGTVDCSYCWSVNRREIENEQATLHNALVRALAHNPAVEK